MSAALKKRALGCPDPVRGPVPPAVTLHIDGEPVAQPRARAVVIGGHARIYNPKQADGWKSRVYLTAKAHPNRPPAPWNGGVVVNTTLFFPRPPKLDKRGWPAEAIGCIGKPDRDNADKAILDALTEAGYWTDDSRVYDGPVRKFYHARGGTPGAVIEIIFEEWPKVLREELFA